ncbi:class I SAM-dependent methyltransferase [Candidatus Pacearchaeota archaeon]|nr:class I SAM-dependent methyltransferase [Candidatus Pacearchaeota archaeon]
MNTKEQGKITRRREILLKNSPSIKQLKGIEIGALCYPTLNKEDSNILFLDRLHTSELINFHGSEYSNENFTEVDFVTNDAPLKDVLKGEKYDYFIANHVIEHLPDFIGWMEDLYDHLNDNGIIFLAIPDKFFTFDKNRMETSCGHIIVDYEDNDQVDAAEHFLDALIYHEQIPDIYWSEINKGRYTFTHHHHVFSFKSFLDKIITPLIRLKYLKYSIIEYIHDSKLINEFVIIFRKENTYENIKILGKSPRLQKSPATFNIKNKNYSQLNDIEKQLDAIRRSNLFDPDWYIQSYPEVALAGIDPLKHYFFSAAQCGYNPSPNFDTQWYLENNKDVRDSGLNPLWHYIICGKIEGRKPKMN